MAPVLNAVHSVMTCANVSNIEMVLVDSEVLKRDGALVGHDIGKGAEDLLQSTNRILLRSKLFDMVAAYGDVRRIFPITRVASREQKIGAMIFNNTPRTISNWLLKKMID